MEPNQPSTPDNQKKDSNSLEKNILNQGEPSEEMQSVSEKDRRKKWSLGHKLAFWGITIPSLLTILTLYVNWQDDQNSFRRNRPKLEIKDVAFHELAPGKSLTMSFYLENVGNRIASLSTAKAGWRILGSGDPVNLASYKMDEINTPFQTSIGAGKSMYFKIDAQHFMTQEMVSLVNLGAVRVYLFGEVFYTDSEADQDRLYQFQSWVKPDSSFNNIKSEDREVSEE